MTTGPHSDYSVGWICALPVELTAALTMLDELHDTDLLPQQGNDHNVYTRGRIGLHNLTIACLPNGQMGTISAAIVASQMTATFPSLRFILLVGIGGGIPSLAHDIRLGDVVVSQPGRRDGGVVHYDFGRSVENGRFIATGTLNAPPQLLLRGLSKLKAKHDYGGDRFVRYLSQLTPKLREQFSFPGRARDKLFDAGYDHDSRESDCRRCDVNRLVKRDNRSGNSPIVHYGTIASGNQVVRHGLTRERLRQEFDVICFEMEAAGLMNNFPCIVIRGICDYADSHKNKHWQPYAAAVAAAYAKDLLSVIPAEPAANPTIQVAKISAAEQKSGYKMSQSLRSSLFSQYILLPSNSVALGRLVFEPRHPGQDFFPNDDLASGDVATSDHSRLRETIESARGSKLYQRLVALFSCLWSGNEFPDVQEKSYFLLNSGQCFKALCSKHQTRAWLEMAIRRGRNVYMVVGIHTVHESSIPNGNAMSLRISGPGSHVPMGSPAQGELVFAVQYRKVQFDWFSSHKVENAYLGMCCNRWKVFPIGGRAYTEVEEEDVVEASLLDFIQKEDVEEREFYISDDQMIVF